MSGTFHGRVGFTMDDARWDARDPLFGAPRIDRDEHRTVPYAHRYLTGTCEGTQTRFSMYFPDRVYRPRRMLHYLGPGPGGVTDLIDSGPEPVSARTGVDFPAPSIEFVASCEAFVVESNQGFVAGQRASVPVDVLAYRANAAVARVAARFARETYGVAPERAYLFGGSGGGRRAMLALERTTGLWDGAVPYLAGADGPNTNSIVADVRRRLSDDRAIYRALAAGEHLDSELRPDQLAAVRRLVASGSPLAALSALPVSGIDLGISLALQSRDEEDAIWAQLLDRDPYAEEEILRATATVRRVLTASQLATILDADSDVLVSRKLAMGFIAPDTAVAIEVDAPDVARWAGTRVHLETGAAAGRTTTCLAVVGQAVVGELQSGSMPIAATFDGVRPGDRVRVDNRAYLAFCRSAELPAVVPARTAFTPSGRFTGKMIHVNARHDHLALPGPALKYARLVSETEQNTDRYRLWFVDNATHYPPEVLPPGPAPVVETRLVGVPGVIEHALRVLIDWVECDIAPPMTVPQPDVTIDGAGRREVTVGQPVTLTAHAKASSSEIIRAEWDFAGQGEWVDAGVTAPAAELILATTRRYDRPGRYSATVRVWAHGDGAADARYGRMANLAHVDVDVTPT